VLKFSHREKAGYKFYSDESNKKQNVDKTNIKNR